MISKEHAALVERLAYLEGKLAEFSEARDEVKSQLRELGIGEHVVDGGPTVVIRQTYRFDGALASKVLPAPLLKLITVERPDPRLAKSKLPETVYQKCLKAVGQSEVKLVTEEESES